MVSTVPPSECRSGYIKLAVTTSIHQFINHPSIQRHVVRATDSVVKKQKQSQWIIRSMINIEFIYVIWKCIMTQIYIYSVLKKTVANDGHNDKVITLLSERIFNLLISPSYHVWKPFCTHSSCSLNRMLGEGALCPSLPVCTGCSPLWVLSIITARLLCVWVLIGPAATWFPQVT
jgi:hypothetical protein